MWRKILLISSLSLIGAVIIMLICFATIKVNLNPNIKTENAVSIEIYEGSTRKTEFSTQSEQAKKIRATFNKSFKTSFLNATTNGYSNPKFSLKNVSGKSVSSVTSSAKYSIKFDFDKEEQLYNADGTVFKQFNEAKQYYSCIVTYSEENNKFGTVNLYFVTSEIGSTSITVQMTSHANFEELSKLIEEFLEIE